MMKSSGIGGQAVLEGVMMKNKNCYAVAVRKPNNEIEVKKEEFAGAGERRTLFKVPIFRGMATFVESLVLGMHALTYSSSFYEEEEEQKEVSKVKEALVDIGVVVLSVFFAIVLFILFPLFISSMMGKVIESETLQLVLEGVLRLLLFIAYIALISKMNDIKRVFMYHGAEHKCINCVEQGYELTIANVKKQSKCHKRCGTSFMLVVMLVSFVLFMFIRVEATWLRYILRIVLIPVVAGISYEFIRLAGNTENIIVNFLSRPGLWMQGLTTREPDDSMIEVAIASVEAVFDWRAYQEKEGIVKYRKDSYGRTGKKEQQDDGSDIKGRALGKVPAAVGSAGSAGRSERPVPVSPKERRVERPLPGNRPEGKAPVVNRRKENTPVAGTLRKEEKPVAKSVGKGERPIGKGGSRAETPIARTGMGIKEDRPTVRSGGAEKAMPRSGAKTIKPLGKAEGKPDKVTVKGGGQGEKPAIKIAGRETKGTAPENKETLYENRKEEKAVPKGAKPDNNLVDEAVAAEIQSIEAKGEAGNKIQETVTDTVAKGIQKAEENREAAASQEITESAREIAVSEEASEATLEIAEKEEATEAAQEIAAEEETTEAVQEIAAREEMPEPAQEIQVMEAATEEPQGMAADMADEKIADEKIADKVETETISEDTSALPENGSVFDTAAARNETRNKDQERRRTNLISFMSTPDDEEEDEILRALDRYFVYGEEDSDQDK